MEVNTFLAILNLLNLFGLAYLSRRYNKLTLNLKSKQQIIQQTLTSNLELKRKSQKLQKERDGLVMRLFEMEKKNQSRESIKL